jgi:hypothetical protein
VAKSPRLLLFFAKQAENDDYFAVPYSIFDSLVIGLRHTLQQTALITIGHSHELRRRLSYEFVRSNCLARMDHFFDHPEENREWRLLDEDAAKSRCARS